MKRNGWESLILARQQLTLQLTSFRARGLGASTRAPRVPRVARAWPKRTRAKLGCQTCYKFTFQWHHLAAAEPKHLKPKGLAGVGWERFVYVLRRNKMKGFPIEHHSHNIKPLLSRCRGPHGHSTRLQRHQEMAAANMHSKLNCAKINVLPLLG